MIITETRLAGLHTVKTPPNHDARGAFTRLFCTRELMPVLGTRQIVQINHSRTARVGALRGLHFQDPPHAEMKLVRCLRGRVWDVAVDLRAGSPTFMEWHSEELFEDDAKMFVIPEGFAHGFQTLEPQSELLYLHTDFYDPAVERGVRYDDPLLDIPWPLPPLDLSSRDLAFPPLDPDCTGGAP